MDEPERLLAEDGTPEALKEALDAARSRGPDGAQLARMAAALGVPVPPLAPPPLAPPPLAPPPLAPTGLAASAIAKVALAVMGLAALGALVWVALPDPVAPPAPPVQAPASTEPRLEANPNEASPDETRSDEARSDEASPRETRSDEAAPAPPPPSKAPPPPRRRPAARSPLPPAPAGSPAPEPDEASRFREEAALLHRAERALERDPLLALRLANEHRRRFTDGQLLQEREVIAIDALLRLGNRAGAEGRARAFEVQYGGSVHARRIRRLLSAP